MACGEKAQSCMQRQPLHDVRSSAEGLVDGAALGMSLGEALGILLGLLDGLLDGSELCIALGAVDGDVDSDGCDVGAVLGVHIRFGVQSRHLSGKWPLLKIPITTSHRLRSVLPGMSTDSS